jgi:hypothetical protein
MDQLQMLRDVRVQVVLAGIPQRRDAYGALPVLALEKISEVSLILQDADVKIHKDMMQVQSSALIVLFLKDR